MKKIGLAGRGRFASKCAGFVERRLLAILLDAGGPQSGEAMLIDRELPGEEFIDCQRVAAAGLFKREKPAANRSYDLGLRRMTHRLVPGAGRSAIVSGLPSGPMTYFTLGRWGSVMAYSQTLNH